MDAVASFVERYDVPGMGVYYGADHTRTREPPARTIVNVLPVPRALVDNDVTAKDDLLRTAAGLLRPPSLIVDSGRGLHPYWLLDEPEDVSRAVTNNHPVVSTAASSCAGSSPATLRCATSPASCACRARKTRSTASRGRARSSTKRPALQLHRPQEWVTWQRALIGEPVNPFLAAAEEAGGEAGPDKWRSPR